MERCFLSVCFCQLAHWYSIFIDPMDDGLLNQNFEGHLNDERVELEKLIQLILISSDVDNAVSSDPQFADCVAGLSQLSLTDVAGTPKRIQAEEESIKTKTEQLAVENYPIFLANAETSREVHREFKNISSSNDGLLQNVACASYSAQTIFDNVGKNASSFRVNSKSIQNHAHVMTGEVVACACCSSIDYQRVLVYFVDSRIFGAATAHGDVCSKRLLPRCLKYFGTH